MKFKAFTLANKQIVGRIISPIKICQSRNFCIVNKLKTEQADVSALWDTGASISAISQRLASKLNLKAVDAIELSGIGGKHIANVYKIDIRLPNNAEIFDVRVADFIPNDKFDVIIGMNIITLGGFSITNSDRKTVFSYRVPPNNFHIDFTKM